MLIKDQRNEHSNSFKGNTLKINSKSKQFKDNNFENRLGYACPDAYNPADFFIKTLSVTDSNMAADRQKNKKICDYFIVSEYAEDLEYVINHEFELRHSLQVYLSKLNIVLK